MTRFLKLGEVSSGQKSWRIFGRFRAGLADLCVFFGRQIFKIWAFSKLEDVREFPRNRPSGRFRGFPSFLGLHHQILNLGVKLGEMASF